jgi:hypothetical protein
MADAVDIGKDEAKAWGQGLIVLAESLNGVVEACGTCLTPISIVITMNATTTMAKTLIPSIICAAPCAWRRSLPRIGDHLSCA